MSGHWKGQTVRIKVEQLREYKPGEKHWHTLSTWTQYLDTDVLADFFDEYSPETHRFTITPVGAPDGP